MGEWQAYDEYFIAVAINTKNQLIFIKENPPLTVAYKCINGLDYKFEVIGDEDETIIDRACLLVSSDDSFIILTSKGKIYRIENFVVTLVDDSIASGFPYMYGITGGNILGAVNEQNQFFISHNNGLLWTEYEVPKGW